MYRKIIISVIRIIFLVCPILWLVFIVDYRSVADLLKSLNLYIVLFLLTLTFVRFVLTSLRFWFLISPFSNNIKAVDFILLDWKARYYSIIMPSSAGQDISRAVLLKKHLCVGEILAISVFFRMTGIITLVLLSIFGFFRLYFEQDVSGAMLFAAIVFFAVCTISFVFFSEKATKKILSLLPSKTPKKLVEFLVGASQAILLYKKHAKLVIFNLIFSLILHLLYILFVVILIYSISGEFKTLEILTFIPLIEIFSAAVPFAPNGAGIREGLLILFFNVINQTKEQAFSYITFNTITYLILFLGFFVIVFEKINKKFKSKLT